MSRKENVPDGGGSVLLPILYALLTVVGIFCVVMGIGVVKTYQDQQAYNEALQLQERNMPQTQPDVIPPAIEPLTSAVPVSSEDSSSDGESDAQTPNDEQTPTDDETDNATAPDEPPSPAIEKVSTTQKEENTAQPPSSSKVPQTGGKVTPSPNQEQTDAPNEGTKSNRNTNTIAGQNEDRIVYKTPTGKRYHYDSSCNGGTYIESTMKEVLALGLTPCNKCVQ